MRRFAKLALSAAQPHRGLASQSSIGLQATKTKEITKKNQTKEITKKNQTNVCHCERATRKKYARTSSQDSRYGISPKAVELIEKVLVLPDVDEEVCKELDRWTAEGKFPIAYIKQTMQVFEREKRWNRLTQVSEWMLKRGEGKTLRTYEAFLKALDMDGRVDQAEAVWKNEILKSSWSIPTRLVTYVLAMFERHHMPLEVIKLFTKMEDSGRNMCKKSIRTVARAYEQQGFIEMKKQVLLKYKISLQETEASSTALTV